MGDASSPRERGRPASFSFRALLLVLLPLLTGLTGVALTLRSYRFARDTVTVLSRDVFRGLSHQAVAQTRAHLSRAEPAGELARRLVADGLGLTVDDRTQLSRTLLAVLDANPPFSWVGFGGVDGTFVGAHRLGSGERRLNQSWITEDGRTRLEEYALDQGPEWVLDRVNDDHGYDPRARPYFSAARNADAGVWLDPYVFFDQGIPGITFATPTRDAQGRFLGVFTVDFDLNVLSEVVRALAPSTHGETFLFTSDGVLVAHPHASVVEQRGARGQGELVRLSGLADPATQAFVRAAGDHLDCAGEPQRSFAFQSDGETYQGMLTCFPIGADHRWAVGVMAPESDFLGTVQEDIARGLATSLLALLFSVAVAVFLAERVARPLRDVSVEMSRVGRFELAEGDRVPSRFAEIRAIERSLLAMKSGLRSFAAFVPQDVVRHIVQSGEEARLGGELRCVTLFFSDLSGFTTMSEEMEPDALVERLGTYLSEVTRIIQAHGGTVDKFIGDAVMALWGAPQEREHHARDALTAALAIHARLEELSRTEEGAWMRRTHTRIGLATGTALVGNVGTPERMNYTAMGDVVNLAARLEGLNKTYGTRILVSESTVLAAGDAVLARPVERVAVKGKQEGVLVFEPLGLSAEASERERRVVALSQQALERYNARDFAGAAQAWEELLTLRPDDSVAVRMREQALAYRQSPPPDSFCGVYVALSK
ncbi:MAG: adenylate/guanylate cyclase domain-containing protein [Polyangiales bacterium]|nr:hypothetical protein [Myxococcales bacterium]MCB9656858.1 hypothetical protein [Sandaracinaceae bacterium]